MEEQRFRFTIDNFSKKEALITSETFVRGGCEWHLSVYPKGYSLCDDHLSVYLHAADQESLGTGWKRSANFHFDVLNQSGEKLDRSPDAQAILFCAEHQSWGWQKTLPLTKIQGCLEEDILIIDTYITYVEAVDEEGRDALEKKKTVDISGFQVLPSKVPSVRRIFAEHPCIAENFKPNNQAVKTAYMNVLLNLIKKLQKPPKSLSEAQLEKASSELSELMDVGFKLDWLKLKLEKLSLEKKKADADVSLVRQPEENLERIKSESKILKSKLEEMFLERTKSYVPRFQQLEERIKNFESKQLSFKLDSLEAKVDEFSLERKKLDDANESRAQKLEERFKNLDMMELGYKLESLSIKFEDLSLEREKSDDSNESRAQELAELIKNLELEREKSDDFNESRAQQLEKDIKELGLEMGYLMNTKLKEFSMERMKTYDAFESRFQQLEGHVEELGFKLDCLDTKVEVASLERKKSDVVELSRVQQLEESVKDLKLMVSYLKVELDKKKDKSSDDGFLLVD